MPRETVVTTLAARLLRLPFRVRGRPKFTPPQKILILQPCCLSQVMLTTPLLSVLHAAFPTAQFHWAVSEWARPAIMGNPLLTGLVVTGPGSLRYASWSDVLALSARLRQEQFDTCFIPSRSSLLSGIAWRAGIPQRVGLDINGRGFAHTIPVPPPPGEVHAAVLYLALAAAVGVDTAKMSRPPMMFHPGDAARKRMTERLIDACDWLGEKPLVLIHPGGGEGGGSVDGRKQWPVERYVRLCNQIYRRFDAQLLLVGGESDVERARAIKGMLAVELVDWTGQITLAELGALAEIADLYIGNDTGPTHIAAAMDCKTIAVFGPSDPRLSAPFGSEQDRVQVIWNEGAYKEESFTWQNGAQVTDVMRAVSRMLD